jgi:7,8-dihydropterin-6-yl-methyl-4-(beta-D-ribofuranosyl)aminobenzene 5'-phosphate synthase
MKLTVVYDNEVLKKGTGLKSDWGFACFIQTDNESILFDSGAKGNILLNNMEKLHLNPRDIDKIVISHEHWDHTGGLTSLLSFIDNAELYRIGNHSLSEKIQLITVEEPRRISHEIHTIGRLIGSPVDEQSLVLQGKKGWYVLVGCSHPGVENILQRAQHIGNITGIIGGFHGFDNFSVLKGLDSICPCHCTQYKKEISIAFPDAYSECGVGKTIDLNEEA